MTGRAVKESQTESNHLVLPSDTNELGTIFGGRVMEWIDLAGAITASRHARRICVTASIDDLHFISPVQLGDTVVLKASVNYAHKTSMEIGVRVESENPLTGERRHTASAYLTFVAIDQKRHPVEVPPVIPKTPSEKRRYQEAEERRRYRLEQKKKKMRTI